MTTCIETIRSQSKPVTEHLVKRHSQTWEHRCKQFTCALEGMDSGSTPQSHLRAEQPKGKNLFLEIVSCQSFWEVLTLGKGKLFVFYY